jgi:hypothetical protein
MPVSITSLQYALKDLWPQSRIKSEVYRDHAFLAMLEKDENFVGNSLYLALRTGDSQGGSAQFAVAQNVANGSASGAPTVAGSNSGVRFNLTRVSDYQIFSIATEAIKAAKDEGALIDGLDVEMMSAANNYSKRLAVSMFRGQTGAIGAVSSSAPVANGFTLSNPNDVTSFELGMPIVASATATGANKVATNSVTIGTATGVVYVESVNRDTGAITVTGSGGAVVLTTGGTPWAANDILFAAGDNANGTGSGNRSSGLADWIPATTPTATPFFGVDRSLDPTRRGGLRLDGSGRTPEEMLAALFNRQCREGGKPSHLFLNNADFLNVQIALQAKVQMEYVSDTNLLFDAITARSPKGPVRLFADQDCPAGRGYSLDMTTWKLYSAGGAPFLQDIDGNVLSREASADRYEGRYCGYLQLGCEAPGFNATVTLPT